MCFCLWHVSTSGGGGGGGGSGGGEGGDWGAEGKV